MTKRKNDEEWRKEFAKWVDFHELIGRAIMDTIAGMQLGWKCKTANQPLAFIEHCFVGTDGKFCNFSWCSFFERDGTYEDIKYVTDFLYLTAIVDIDDYYEIKIKNYTADKRGNVYEDSP